MLFELIGSALTFVFVLIAVYTATRALGAKFDGPRRFEIVASTVTFAVVIGAVVGRIIIPSTPSAPPSMELSATQAAINGGASSACESGSVVAPGGTGHLDVFAKQGSTKDVGANLARFDAFTVLGWAIDRSKMVPAVAACLAIDGRIVGNLETHIGGARPDVATAYANDGVKNSGFVIVVPRDTLDPGSHSISVAAKIGTGTYLSLPGPRSASIR